MDISDSVTEISASAFSGCTGLTSVDISNSVTTIADFVFEGCSNLTSVNIPGSVTYIGNSAFYGCIGLTSVDIPSSVTTIGSFAFGYCIGLTSVTIPDYVTKIDGFAFDHCTGLTSFYVGDTNPNYCAIDGVLFNKNVTKLVAYPNAKGAVYEIPNSVTGIEYSAFSGCVNLTSVTIPNSVTEIGNYTFASCDSISQIRCYATEPPTLCSASFSNYSALLYVPAESVATYKAASYWRNFYDIYPIDETGIENTSIESDEISIDGNTLRIIGSGYCQLVAISGCVKRSGTGNCNLALTPGIYIVTINGHSHKIAIR